MGQKKNKQNKKMQTKLPKMALVMIVKNEAHIITETLTNILKYIDYWVISDTGSTDGTQDIIKNFFAEKGIPGELVEHEWKNFGYNRTKAFETAYNKSDYVWVIDADDLIVGELVIPKNLDKDMYLLKYGGVNLCYPRAQIFNNRLKWTYRGVLHEFSKCTNKDKLLSQQIDGKYYVDSRRLGDRNKDPQKYLKDAQVLIKAIDDGIDPDLKERYTFYIGQSYRDCNDLENSIKYYKKRTEMGGWNEEIYVSYMEIGIAMIKLKYPKKEIIGAFMNGFKILPIRSECLFFLSNYYLQCGEIENAYKTCKIASKIQNPTHLLLFIKTDIHLYGCKELLYLIYCLIQQNKIEIKNLSNDTIEKEKEILYDFLTTSNDVPQNIKNKIVSIKENNNKVFIQPTMLDDYMFIDNVDSYGSDIGLFENKSVNELQEITELYDDCICFNTYGYLKHTLNLPLIPLQNKNYMNDGLYIKKDIAKKLLKKYGINLFDVSPKVSLKIEDFEKIIIDDVNDIDNNDIMKIEFKNKINDKINIVDDEIKNEITDIYDKELIDKITEHIKNVDDKKISFSVTTCKRLDLFIRTMNSFINCCQDILLIDEYICVDDNSTEKDREEMKKLYPFFKWIFKTPEQKGHVESMNMIIQNVKTDYLIHLEDDWLFLVKDNYITNGLEILNQTTINALCKIPEDRNISKKTIGQVVFNKNYTELPENEVEGGYLCETQNKVNYLIHEHYNTQTEKELYEKHFKKYKRNCIYWPHYSLQPSILKTEIFKKVGNFTKNATFFEREFAERYYRNNFMTCFFNRVSCKHIGKLLSQRNNPEFKNAYELNEVNQFNQFNQNKIIDLSKNKDYDNYIFYPNKDSVDYDIIYIQNKTINELKNIADSLPACVGFNTLGYLKYKIVDKDKFIHLPNLKNNIDGLYVKK